MSSEDIPAAKQKRLQQCFEHASKQAEQDNHDYASDLFTTCLQGDPGNVDYVTGFMKNLQAKYGDNKKGSKLGMFTGAGARGAVKKAAGKKEWDAVLDKGREALKLNPWDMATLVFMAEASENLGHDECQLFYLKSARDANPKDPDINRVCAIALANRGLYNQAIDCWARVEQAKPNDPEAQKAIAELAVARTKTEGDYDAEGTSKKVLAAQGAKKAAAGGEGDDELSLEDQLLAKIKKHPLEVDNYLDLAKLFLNRDDFKNAEKVLTKAYEVSEQDIEIRERLEDAQLRGIRKDLTMLDAKRKQTKSKEDEEKFQQIKKEYDEKSLAVSVNRCDRYPNNLAFKFELGQRYQIVGKFDEAIKQYQAAQNDPRKKGMCMLALGQCFQKIKQHRLAMNYYETAITEIPDRDAVNKKIALYLAGKLSMELKDLDKAEKLLTVLAELDFSYRDVSKLLDKIDELRNNE